jgi:hypothetical protein
MKNLSIFTVIVALLVLMPFAASEANTGVIPPHHDYLGKSYGEWSAAWWQWAYSLPGQNHPLTDFTGMDCDAGQSGGVWFLAGTWVDACDCECQRNPKKTYECDPGNQVIRGCTVPAGKALYFPILNVECNTAQEGSAFYREDVGELEDCAASFVDGEGNNPFNAIPKDLEVEINGVLLENPYAYRTQSSVFEFHLPEGNILGVDAGVYFSASDGYFIMLAPLPKGQHTIRFAGKFVNSETGDLIYGLHVIYYIRIK